MPQMDRPSRTRLLRGLLYAVVLVSSALQVAVVPLLPAYARHFGLSHVGQGVLLGATGLATLAVCVPAGALSDRLGAKRVTIWAGELMALAGVLQAVAPSFLWLVVARLVFGLGYGLIWTAGLSWLAESAPGGSSLGGSVVAGGAGSVLGPGLFGLLAEYFGLRVPFLASAALLLLVTAALAVLRLPSSSTVSESHVGQSLRAAVSDRTTVSAAAAIMIAGVTSGVAYLLVPGELHADGGSQGAIGLAFSAASLLFVVGSLLTTTYGSRAVRMAVACGGMLALAIALSPAALSSAPVAVIAMLCASSSARSVLWTISYPLGAAGAARSGAGLGVVMGLLNGVWAATSFLTPLLAGIVAEHVSAQSVFGLSEATCVVVLAAVVVMRREALSGFLGRQLHSPDAADG